MANSYQPWESFPLAEQDTAGTLGDKALAAQAQQVTPPPPTPAPIDTTPKPTPAGAIDAFGKLGDEPLIAQINTSAGPSYDTNLGMTRTRFASEMQSNPDLRRKLMASMTAEVGDQGAQAQQAYLETVMNRAAARGASLDATISNPKYYPTSTTSKLGATFSADQQAKVNPLINNVLSGSNLSSFATGNESAGVHSGGAPVTFNPSPGSKTGDRFVIENADRRWAAGFTRIAQQTPTPAPTPARKLTWQELMATSPMVAGP
jgi:hypothetical protein